MIVCESVIDGAAPGSSRSALTGAPADRLVVEFDEALDRLESLTNHEAPPRAERWKACLCSRSSG